MNLGGHCSTQYSLPSDPPFMSITQAKDIHPTPISPKILTHSSINSKSQIQSKYEVKSSQISSFKSSKSGMAETGFGPFWGRMPFLPQPCETRKQVNYTSRLLSFEVSSSILNAFFLSTSSTYFHAFSTSSYSSAVRLGWTTCWNGWRKGKRLSRQNIGLVPKKLSSTHGSPVGLRQESANLFCKGPGKKCFWLWELYGLCGNYSALLLQYKSSHRQWVNEFAELTCKLYLQNVKGILNSWAMQ